MTTVRRGARTLQLTALGWAATEPGANPPTAPTARTRYGLCPACGWRGALDKQGLMQAHRRRDSRPGWPRIGLGNCSGEGRQPEVKP